jgi:hypothetical protein
MHSNSNSKRDILKPAWRDFALRAQSIARNNKNATIIRMTVLVNTDGNPMLWTEPKIIKLEPRLSFDFASLDRNLNQEELLALLEVIATNE